jgi:SAM-dependent methyltransferase
VAGARQGLGRLRLTRGAVFRDDSFWSSVFSVLFDDAVLAQGAHEVGQILALSDVQEGRVLDLACGPGRHSIPLAKRGFKVTGVDASPFLVSRARERALQEGVEVEFVLEDMRTFLRLNSFRLALCLWTSFGLLETEEEDLAVLVNLRHSLEEGGVLVLDVMGREVLAGRFQATSSRRASDGTLLVERRDVREHWTILHNEWVVVRAGRAICWEFDLRLYGASDLLDLARRAGFQRAAIYGGLDGRPYDQQAERLVLVARA